MTASLGEEIAAIFERTPQLAAWNDEDQLQEWIHRTIVLAGIPTAVREVRLSDKRSRIDIMIPPAADRVYGVPHDALGIEIKIKGSHADTLRQLQRYALCPEIGELVLITTKASHLGMPARLNGKPLTLIPLLEGGL
jgi:hypothetical protein